MVEVGHLTIKEDAQLMSDPDIRRLFVAYNFLGVNPAELETPISLPKPRKAGQELTFNFRKGKKNFSSLPANWFYTLLISCCSHMQLLSLQLSYAVHLCLLPLTESATFGSGRFHNCMQLSHLAG